jgi:hypothetical protein
MLHPCAIVDGFAMQDACIGICPWASALPAASPIIATPITIDTRNILTRHLRNMEYGLTLTRFQKCASYFICAESALMLLRLRKYLHPLTNENPSNPIQPPRRKILRARPQSPDN